MESHDIGPDNGSNFSDEVVESIYYQSMVVSRMLGIGMRVSAGYLTPEMQAGIKILSEHLRSGYRIVIIQRPVPYNGNAEDKLWVDGAPEDGPEGAMCTHFDIRSFPPNGKES